MVAAALGLERGASLSFLRTLDFGVRVDREGVLKRDFQTVLDVASVSGGVSKDPQISDRHYLADAVFLAALGGDPELVGSIDAALRSPRWPLFLGRRSYVPSIPPFDPKGPADSEDLRAALLAKPLLVPRKPQELIRLELTSREVGTSLRFDDPLSFDSRHRDYQARSVQTEYLPASLFGAAKPMVEG